jgi:hypothetical protein
MTRTKTNIRSMKAKGSAFEMDCAYSLKNKFPSIRRIGQEGFQLQYDLECDYYVYECKRLKSLSWNQAVKFFIKLLKVKPKGKMDCYLLFKSNQQPCLVMYQDYDTGLFLVTEFEDYFGVPFLKHPSMRKQNEKN